LCVVPEQAEVCKQVVDGGSCRFNGIDGVCLGGICVPQSCGDGLVTGAEECDGDALGALATCRDLGYYDDVLLTCGDDCRYDRSRCTAGLCGDGVRNGPEVCDGNQLEHADCFDIGYYENGPLSCNDACGYNTSACVGYCGDGELNGPEVCEEGLPILDTCVSYGYDRGYIACGRCVPDIRGCRYIGWRETPITLSTQIRAIHGTARDNVFAAGSDGALLHWQGIRWNVLTPATFDHFRAVAAFAPDHAIALGELGTIQRYDGTAWTTMLNDPTWRFNAVARVGTEAFAVGSKGVLRYNGTSWSTFVAPGTTELVAVWGSSATDLYAIDTAGVFSHFTGVMWQPIALPAPAVAVWGNSATNVYVSTTSAVHHLVNNSWPTNLITNSGVMAGTGMGGTDVCLAGGPLDNSVWCYTGGFWNMIAGFATGFGTVNAMWGSGPDDVFLAGSAGVAHFDGATWFGTTNANPAPRSLWGDASVVYAVNGNILRSTTANGLFSTVLTSTSGQALFGVWGASPSDVFAVGQSGTIQRYNGSAWSKMTNADSRTLLAVWGSSGTNVYAVGSGGAILRYTGTWGSVVPGTTMNLTDVWGSSATDIFAVGAGGTIVHSSGGAFTPMTSTTTRDLRGVFGTSPTNVYAVGDVGTLLHYDGTGWTQIPSGTGTALNDVWGFSANDVFAVGDFGTMLYFDGSTWTPVNGPSGHIVFAYGIGNQLYVASSSLLILQRLAPWN
jgi:hypothetical protein